MKLDKQKIIKELSEEFKILKSGNRVFISVKVPTFKVKQHFTWEEEDYGSSKDLDDLIINKAMIAYKKAFDIKMNSFNDKIYKFLKKCDKLADQLNIDRYDFFNRVRDYGDGKQLPLFKNEI